MDDVLFPLLFRSRPSFVRPSSGDQTKNRLFIGDSSNFGRDEAPTCIETEIYHFCYTFT